MNPATFSSFLAAVLVLNLIPGPGMLFIIANGIASGGRAGVAVAIGTAAGMLVHTTVTALGLAALFSALPAALTVLKIIGATYLLWLAVQAFRAKSPEEGHQVIGPASAGAQRDVRFWSFFRRGALNNLANSTIVAFYVVFLPQFVDPTVGNVTGQLFVLGATMLLIGLAIDLPIGLLAGRLGSVLLRSRVVRRVVNKITGTVYGALAARLIATH